VQLSFYRLTWHAQLAAGALLFVLSLAIEAAVLAQYLANAVLAALLALGLEVSKAVTIVLHRFLAGQDGGSYPVPVRSIVLVFRAALLVLSALCSLMYLAHKLDRPHLEAVRQADLASIEQAYTADHSRVEQQFAQQAAQADKVVAARFAQLREQAADRYLPAIQRLEAQLTAEMDNSVKGNFVGPRYRAISSRLQNEQSAYRERLDELAEQEARERAETLDSLRDDQERELSRLRSSFEARAAQVREGDYTGDSRVENPMITAFTRVVHRVSGFDLDPLLFIFLFSVFISLIVELGIVASFETLTSSHLPILSAAHRVKLHVTKHQIESEGDLRAARIDDAAQRKRTAAWVRDIARAVGFGSDGLDGKLADRAEPDVSGFK
jgi:hypothetical protein